MTDTTATISVFYAFKHRKLILLPKDEARIEFPQLAILLDSFNVSSVGKMHRYGNVVKRVIEKLAKDKWSVKELESKIMNPDFFKNSKIESLIDIFNSLEDGSPLKIRLDEVFKSIDECLICYDKESNLVFKCAHQMCADCYSKLEKKDCPFCREDISATMRKIDFIKMKEEEEIRKRLAKEKRIEEEKKNGTYDPYSDNNYEEVKIKLPTLLVVENVDEFLVSRIKSILVIKGAMTPTDKEEVELLVNHYGIEEVWKLFSNVKLLSEEVTIFVIGLLFKKSIKYEEKKVETSDEEKKWLDRFSEYLKSPNKILRFLAVLNGKDPKPDQQIKMKFTNRIKKFIFSLLNSCGETCRTYTELMLHRPIWKLLMKSLHGADKKKFGSYKVALKLVAWLRTNEAPPIKGKMSTMETYFQKRDKRLFEFFVENPGLFYRNARRFVDSFKNKNEEKWEEFIKTVVEKLKTDQLIQLSYVLDIDDSKINKDPKKYLSTINKAGVMHWHHGEQVASSPCSQLVVREIDNKLFSLSKGELCIIDNRDDQLAKAFLKRGQIPKEVEWTNKIPASRGDIVALDAYFDDQTEIVAGIYWKNGAESCVDLDLSIAGLDQRFEQIDDGICDYTRLTAFGGKMSHSGDIRNAPTGASEYIKFNVKSLCEVNKSTKYLLITCLSFNEIPFEKMGDAMVWIGVKSDKIKGTGPYECKIIEACKLQGTTKVNLSAIINLEEKQFLFSNLNIKSKDGYNSVATRMKLLTGMTENFVKWRDTTSIPPSWKFVAEKIATNYNKIIIRTDKGDIYLQKGTEETNEQIHRRIKELKGDIIPEQLIERLKAKPEIKEELIQLIEPPWLYIGNGCDTATLPSKSTLICTQTPDLNDESIIFINDPFKFFV